MPDAAVDGMSCMQRLAGAYLIAVPCCSPPPLPLLSRSSSWVLSHNKPSWWNLCSAAFSDPISDAQIANSQSQSHRAIWNALQNRSRTACKSVEKYTKKSHWNRNDFDSIKSLWFQIASGLDLKSLAEEPIFVQCWRSPYDSAKLQPSTMGNEIVYWNDEFGGAPKEWRRHGAEKQLSKRVFLESPFLLCLLKVFRCFKSKSQGGREETDSPKIPFGQLFLRTTPSSPLARFDNSTKIKNCNCEWFMSSLGIPPSAIAVTLINSGHGRNCNCNP